jgi:hypothetical protein
VRQTTIVQFVPYQQAESVVMIGGWAGDEEAPRFVVHCDLKGIGAIRQIHQSPDARSVNP